MDTIAKIAEAVFWIVFIVIGCGIAIVVTSLLMESRTQIEIERLLRDEDGDEPHLRAM